jgi:hypothetical protein
MQWPGKIWHPSIVLHDVCIQQDMGEMKKGTTLTTMTFDFNTSSLVAIDQDQNKWRASLSLALGDLTCTSKGVNSTT